MIKRPIRRHLDGIGLLISDAPGAAAFPAKAAACVTAAFPSMPPVLQARLGTEENNEIRVRYRGSAVRIRHRTGYRRGSKVPPSGPERPDPRYDGIGKTGVHREPVDTRRIP